MISLVLFASFFIFVGCDKKENSETGKLDVFTVLIDATSYSDWIYFSFAEGGEVSIVDAQTSSDWDLGLKRSYFKTNSGTSGGETGGAYDAGVVDFDTFIDAPTDGYTIDSSIEVFDFVSKEYISEPGNALLGTWGEFTQDMPPTFIPSNKVFVIRTADGKYAKMIVQNYYGTGGSGYITFSYAYQADGTTNIANEVD